MKAFADGGKFGTPVKKRSRRISTSDHGVTDRIALITTNTNLRTLSIAVAPNSPKVTVGNLRHLGTWANFRITPPRVIVVFERLVML